jgi:chorismate mutase
LEGKTSVRLSKEEFNQRLSERRKLLALSILEDVKIIFPANKSINGIKFQSTPRLIGDTININLDLTKQIAKLVSIEVHKAIDIVYEEKVD